MGNRHTVRLSVPVDGRWSQGFRPDFESEAAQFIQTIRRRWLANHGDQTGAVAIKHAYIRKTVPRFLEVRDRLAGNGVIDFDKKFVPDKHSMRYRVRPEFRTTRVADYSNETLCRAIENVRLEAEGNPLPVHRWLRESLKLLEFDLDRALAIVSCVDEVPEKRRKRVLTLDDYRLMLSEQCKAFKEELTSGTPELTCDQHGRVHTSFSRLPGIVRGCVSIGGEPLVGLDLKNAQPLFLGMVAVDFQSSSQARNRILKYEPNTEQPYGRQQRGGEEPPYSFTTMWRKLQGVDSNRVYGKRLADIFSQNEYLATCEQGKLYESLLLPGEDRDWLKHRILVDVLYGADDYESPIRERFEGLFPHLHKIVTTLKTSKLIATPKPHKHLSWLLQNRESRMFIGTICRRIMDERPSMPLFTIHDACCTTAEYIDFLEAVAMDEFARLGVTPTFKRETYD